MAGARVGIANRSAGLAGAGARLLRREPAADPAGLTMSTPIHNLASARFAELLRADDGLTAVYADFQQRGGPDLPVPTVLEQYIAADLAEKAASVRYPVIHVYCERLVNKLAEKFRRVSGTVSLAAEVRASADHYQELQQTLAAHADAVAEVLHRHRGDWGSGIFYTGGYEIEFQPIRRGGKNYLQSAVITLEAHISA